MPTATESVSKGPHLEIALVVVPCIARIDIANNLEDIFVLGLNGAVEQVCFFFFAFQFNLSIALPILLIIVMSTFGAVYKCFSLGE